MACVTSSHFSINVNGSAEGFFPGKRGLRQGDPLFPYLFTMYDLLVFTRGDLPSIQVVDRCLKQFAALSGLRVKLMKSNLYFRGVSSQLKQLILSAPGYVEGDLPVRIAKQIHKICKDFLLGIEEGRRRLVFKSWESLCRPRKEGGVDIKEILSWNKSQMMSWIKKLETNAPNVWVKWVRAYILKGVDFWEFKLTSAHSSFWSNIINCRDCLIMLQGGVAPAKHTLNQKDYKS
ncbi:uncharacterized protein LOC141643946 [Silene latifolia]|uniref:uncharacterized protein LOC141643946 n=1 Tax=Silene latifolia TaxID=37657 RepID=UPI003D7802AA